MLIHRGRYRGYDVYTTEDVVDDITSVEFEHKYGETISEAIYDIQRKRMCCDTIIVTTYQVLVLPVPRYDFNLLSVFQLPNAIGDTTTTAEKPVKVK